MKKSKTFVHNGIKYQRLDDMVLFKLKDAIDGGGMYLGIGIKKDGNAIKMTHTYNAHEHEAFIFMVSKEIFEKYGTSNTIQMLKKENMDLSIFSGTFKAEIV